MCTCLGFSDTNLQHFCHSTYVYVHPCRHLSHQSSYQILSIGSHQWWQLWARKQKNNLNKINLAIAGKKLSTVIPLNLSPLQLRLLASLRSSQTKVFPTANKMAFSSEGLNPRFVKDTKSKHTIYTFKITSENDPTFKREARLYASIKNELVRTKWWTALKRLKGQAPLISNWFPKISLYSLKFWWEGGDSTKKWLNLRGKHIYFLI